MGCALLIPCKKQGSMILRNPLVICLFLTGSRIKDGIIAIGVKGDCPEMLQRLSGT